MDILGDISNMLGAVLSDMGSWLDLLRDRVGSLLGKIIAH